MLKIALDPRSVAVIGASDGYRGAIYPINPSRSKVQDLPAFARMAARLGDAMLAWRGRAASVDVNPVMVFETGRGAVAVDALIERTL